MHELKTQVENNILVIQGRPEESVGCVLRGYVALNTKENLKVKSIYLSLTGKIKLQWTERKQQQKRACVIFEHRWEFLPLQKKPKTLLANTYHYPFELVLPGHLAESIDTNTFGSLSYKLKATVERPSFLPNLIHRKPLWIIRHTDPLVMPIQVADTLSQLYYSITIPKRTFARGQSIPIDFLLVSQPHLYIRHLSCFLKEYGTCGTHRQSRIIRFLRDEHFSLHGPQWHKIETITVPVAPSAIQIDAKNDYFKIYHKLKFTISIMAHGEVFEIRTSIPIEVVNRTEELPSYDPSWTTIDTRTINPCIRLPSYHTVNMDDGLPAYEV